MEGDFGPLCPYFPRTNSALFFFFSDTEPAISRTAKVDGTQESDQHWYPDERELRLTLGVSHGNKNKIQIKAIKSSSQMKSKRLDHWLEMDRLGQGSRMAKVLNADWLNRWVSLERSFNWVTQRMAPSPLTHRTNSKFPVKDCHSFAPTYH
jgi:hypothetical protein